MNRIAGRLGACEAGENLGGMFDSVIFQAARLEFDKQDGRIRLRHEIQHELLAIVVEATQNLKRPIDSYLAILLLPGDASYWSIRFESRPCSSEKVRVTRMLALQGFKAARC